MTTQEMIDEVREDAYQRLLQYAGKRRSEVRNPHITANEAIYIANFIERLQRERDEARAEAQEQARLLGMGSEREARLRAERDEAWAEKYELLLVLERHGFRRCDIPACNCGSWHQVGGFAERFREIEEVTEGYYRNGETLLDRITRIVNGFDAAREDG